MSTVDAPPSPLPSPPPTVRSPFGIGWRTPDAPPSTPLPSPASSPENPSQTTDGPAPASGLDSDGTEWDQLTDPTPSPASTQDSDRSEAVKVELFTEAELQDLTRAGVAAAGEKVHEVLAVTPGQQHVGLYKTDEDDQANIGDPLASIAARHQGLGGKVNPDTKDMLSAMVGIAGYFTKQINLRNQARAIDAGAAADQGPVDL